MQPKTNYAKNGDGNIAYQTTRADRAMLRLGQRTPAVFRLLWRLSTRSGRRDNSATVG